MRGAKTTRRSYLAAVSIASVATAGCASRFEDFDGGPAETRADERVEGSWPTQHFDRRNTRTTEAAGPKEQLGVIWEGDGLAEGDPIISDSLVYTSVDFTIRTLEAATGEWVDTPINGMSGRVHAVTDSTVYSSVAVDGGLGIIATSAEDGTELWDRTVDGEYVERLVVADDTVHVFSPELVTEGYELELCALDRVDGTENWSVTVPIEWSGNATKPHLQLVAGDDLVVVAAGERLLAFDSTTGERLWTDPLDVDASELTAGPVATTERIIVGTEAGDVLALDSSGGLDWKIDADSQSGAFLVGDQYVHYDATRIGRIDIESGERVDSIGSSWSTPIARGTDALYVHGEGERVGTREVRVIDPKTGAQRSAVSFDRSTIRGAAVIEDTLLITRYDEDSGNDTVVALGATEKE